MGTGEAAAADPGGDSARERTWTSGLSVDEFACVRIAGFEPVGQVMGAAVYGRNAPMLTYLQDPYYGSPDRPRSMPMVRPNPAYSEHTVIRAARRDAMRRMTDECRALGGDGIIAVRVAIEPFEGDETALAFRIQGTAVRARGRVRPPKPFSSDLSAQEFTKLIHAGWVPVELVLGASVATLHEVSSVQRQTRRTAPNQEISVWSAAIEFIRVQARKQVRVEAAGVGADGVVVSSCDLELYQVEKVRFAEARVVGTAIATFGPDRSGRRRTGTGRPPVARTGSILRLSTDHAGHS